MDDKMTWPLTWRHFLELGFSGGGVSCPASRGRTRKSSSGEAQLNKNILLPLILLRHIHHLPHITMSWPSILDRPEAFSTVVETGPKESCVIMGCFPRGYEMMRISSTGYYTYSIMKFI
jgi:hypothetical protein